MIIIELRDKSMLFSSYKGMNLNKLLDSYVLETDYGVYSLSGISNKEIFEAYVNKGLQRFDRELDNRVGVVINMSSNICKQSIIPKVSSSKLSETIDTSLSELELDFDMYIKDFKILPNKENKKSLNSMSFAIKREFLMDILYVLESRMHTDVVLVDVSNNTIDKIYQKAYKKNMYPIDIISHFDTMSESVTMYIFIKGSYSYSITQRFSNNEDMRSFDIESFNNTLVDVASQSSFSNDDVRVIQFGGDGFKLVETNYDDVNLQLTNIISPFDALPTLDFVFTYGSLLRDDKYLTSNVKKDINFISVMRNYSFTYGKGTIGVFVIAGVVSILSIISLTQFLQIKSIESEISYINSEINAPALVQSMNKYNKLSDEKIKTEGILSSLIEVNGVLDVKSELTQDIIKSINYSIPKKSELLSLSYSNGFVVITISTKSPEDVSNFVTNLKSSAKYSKVTYEAYSIDGGHYGATINASLKGGN